MTERANPTQDRQLATGDEPKCFAPDSPLLTLMHDAWVKAERAWQQWQCARLTGDRAAAERARRLMLRHQAIAWHLDPQRRDACDTA
jgi:hypothetical protein